MQDARKKVVPRDGIEPPKNTDIIGLFAVFDRQLTSFPDKIPDRKMKT